MIKRTSEKDLIAPAIVVLLKNADEKGCISSSDFRKHMMKLIRSRLTVADKELLPSRPVSRIEQTLMNLVSHRALDKRGLTKYNTSTGVFKVRAKTRDLAISALAESLC